MQEGSVPDKIFDAYWTLRISQTKSTLGACNPLHKGIGLIGGDEGDFKF